MISIHARSCLLCGRIDHYYHHLLDYVLPLWIEMRGQVDWMLGQHDVQGRLRDHMDFWFCDRRTSAAPEHKVDIRGMDPRYFGWFSRQIEAFGQAMKA